VNLCDGYRAVTFTNQYVGSTAVPMAAPREERGSTRASVGGWGPPFTVLGHWSLHTPKAGRDGGRPRTEREVRGIKPRRGRGCVHVITPWGPPRKERRRMDDGGEQLQKSWKPGFAGAAEDPGHGRVRPWFGAANARQERWRGGRRTGERAGRRGGAGQDPLEGGERWRDVEKREGETRRGANGRGRK